jgi:hypothetical protein
VAGQAHRLFVWSADVFVEPQDEPWNKVPAWAPEAQPAVEFILKQLGPADTHLFCDGRSRAVRQKLESLTEKDRHLSELWVVYRPMKRLGRRVSFASDNREVMFLSTCLPRTQIPAKERNLYTGAGETTTHASSYTNVPAVPWRALPQIATKDKCKIVAGTAATPKSETFDPSLGVPLYWAERKPLAFWQQLIMDLDVKCIVDLSPGSGTLARAAMLEGARYLGITRSEEHASWLLNVLDRHAVAFAARSGSPLFEQNLAECIRRHYQDELQQLQDAETMQDSEPEGECAEG